jgi:hypothetical protein
VVRVQNERQHKVITTDPYSDYARRVRYRLVRFCLVSRFLDCPPSVAPVLILETKVHANKPREIYWFLG